MQENKDYLSNQELENMIAELESGSLLQAPDYLEKMILQKAERIAVRSSVEIVPIRHAIRAKKQPASKKTSRQGQLLAYSLKIAAAAAAAIALVIVVPEMQRKTEDSYQQQEEYMEELQKEQKEQEETWKKNQERKSVTRNLNEKTSDFCSKLFEKTNELLFRREEK